MSAAIPADPDFAAAYRPAWSERLGPYYKYFLLAPLGVMLIGFFAGPLLWMFRVSLYESRGASGFGIGGAKGQEGGGYYVEGTWTLDNYVRFFSDEYFRSILLFTLEFAILVTVVTIVLAYPMAYYIYKAGPRLKTALLIVVILPKLSNMLVLVYGLQILLANNGLVNELLLLLGVAGLRGGAMALAQPLMISILAKSAGPDQGKGVGVRTTANRLVSFVVPVIMGAVVEVVGLETSFLVIGGVLMACAIGIAVYIRRSPRL